MNAEDQKSDERRITYFAATHTRGKREMFGIRAIDRGKHIYVIGKTGMGKSTLLENMAIQDIQNGEGISFIDPHGSTAEKLLDFIPYERIQDVIYFAPFDTDHPVGFNVMEDVGYDKRHLVVSGLMGALKRIWVDAWSARMEYILQNTLLALLEYPDSTLLDVNKMLTNKVFRGAVVEKITDPIVKAFWTEEFANFTDTYTREATPAIQNKIGQFTANPLIRNIVGQAKSSFDLREIMDKKKIFIVNLSKGRMGETNAALLGSMLTVKIYLSAMSRADEPVSVLNRLPRHYFYVDEFQSMMNEAFADILSESRKYKLALILANQYIEQMEEEVRDAVFGNVGTMIVFRVGPFDAEVLETVFTPTFTPEDLIGLGIGQIYLTLMIDGVGSPPFSAETIPPIEPPRISYREDVVNHSRALYTRSRSDVEAQINKKQLDFAPLPKKEKSLRTPGSFSNDRPPFREGARPDFPRHIGGATIPQRTLPSVRPVTTSSTAQSVVPNSVRLQSDAPHPDRRESPDQRSSLRAAIEAARGSNAAPAPTPKPPVVIRQTQSRSPADILREKKSAKADGRPKEQNQPPKPKAPLPPELEQIPGTISNQPQVHFPRSSHPYQAPFTPPASPGNNGYHEKQESVQEKEVSKELLERVLNGTSRDD
jgi:energy-coupling factor transporter ATP-binding protein EcfA2